MMQTIGCDFRREGGRILGTTVLALLAGMTASVADGDWLGQRISFVLLALSALLIVAWIFRLFQQSLFSDEARFLMTLPISTGSLLKGKLAVGIMWTSIAELAYCTPVLYGLLRNEALAFEQDHMQMIIYWMMERDCSQGDISLFFALVVPIVLIGDGLFCSLMLYLCFLKNNGKKQGTVFLVAGSVAAAALLYLVFGALVRKGLFPVWLIYLSAAAGAALIAVLFRHCKKVMEVGHDVS